MSHLICNSALDVGEWLTSLPGRFTLWKRHLYPLNGSLRWSQSESKFWGKRKSLVRTGIRGPFRSVDNIVAVSTKLSRLDPIYG
jgi:hypothetical protein